LKDSGTTAAREGEGEGEGEGEKKWWEKAARELSARGSGKERRETEGETKKLEQE